MPSAAAMPQLLILGAAVLLIAACWRDVATRTLPDAISLTLAVAGLTWQWSVGSLGWSLLTTALVFLCAAAVWRLGAMGGGDVKLLAASALLVGATALPMLLLSTALAGGLLSCVYLAGRRWPPAVPATAKGAARIWRAEMWRLGRGGPLPYGLAIAGGTLFTLMNGV